MVNDGKYYFAMDGKKAFLKMMGTLKYTTAIKFDTFLDNILDNKSDFEDVLIDLSEAVFLDSTNLGFLARISEFMNERYERKVAIYSPKEEINKVLESVGFDVVFVLVKNIDKQEKGLKEISSDKEADRSCSEMMLDAHKALINVYEKNANKFCDVVNLLQEAVDKEKKVTK
ncbi:MAG: STAS domain-containing protein [Spirochaetaceae bacterium]|nr:STAS domain-containing protein [Spirochaetaceae bacterium]